MWRNTTPPVVCPVCQEDDLFLSKHPTYVVIKCADWVIDLGPEGGARGGQIIASGTPEQVARVPASHTGQWLAKALR